MIEDHGLLSGFAMLLFSSLREIAKEEKEPLVCHCIQKLTPHFMKYKSTPVSKIKYMNKTLISVMGRTQKEWEQKAAFGVTPVPVMMGRDQCSIGCTSQSLAQITIRSRMIPLLLVQGC